MLDISFITPEDLLKQVRIKQKGLVEKELKAIKDKIERDLVNYYPIENINAVEIRLIEKPSALATNVLEKYGWEIHEIKNSFYMRAVSKEKIIKHPTYTLS
jgi:hypothetical protein